jgi:hypothetical protein
MPNRTLKKSILGLFQPRCAEVNSAPLPESFGFFKASVIPPGRPGPGRLLFQQPADHALQRTPHRCVALYEIIALSAERVR